MMNAIPWCMAARSLGPVRLAGADIRGLMRAHGLTIEALARRMGVTMVRIREVRSGGLSDPYAIRDWVQAITGRDPGNGLDHPAIERKG